MPRIWGAVRRRSASVIMLVAVTVGAASCGQSAGARAAAPDLRGRRLEVVAVWSQTEQERVEHVLRSFESATGATVTYVSGGRRLTEFLDSRIRDGDPPDLAVLPQPGLLHQYARAGLLVPVGTDAATEVRRNYAPVWRDLGSVDGRLY